MTRFVNFFAPRSTFDFILKFVLINVVVVCFAVGVMLLTHGGFPFGIRRQVIDTTIMGAPFVLLALFVFSHQRKLQQQLASIATTDFLTDLHNRRGFFEKVDPWLQKNAGGTFMLADIDHFKSINDTFGHDVGDHCLKAVADLLRSQTRDNDLIARIGGEEFALCIAPCEDKTISNLAAALNKGVDLDALAERAVTLSVGGVTVEQHQKIEHLLSKADRRLYCAKSSGRARAVLCEGDEQAAVI